MKKIAVIYRNLAGLSGVPNILCQQVHMLADKGYEVDLIAERIDKDRFKHDRIGFVKIHKLPFFKRKRLQFFSDRANRISAREYDFVVGHGHNTKQDVLTVHNCVHLYYERIPDSPKIVGSDALMQDQIFSESVFRVCIANSQLMRDELVRRYGLDDERLKVVYPGYDPNRFNTNQHDDKRQLMRSKWGIADDQILIGLVTSGAFQLRGVDIAIDAFSKLKKSVRKNTRLVVVGNNSQINDFKRQAVERGLEDKIIFQPAVREVEYCYHALDILIHPARLETFGLVVQEAMACGLPVIANRQVGATELLPVEAQSELAEAPSIDDSVDKLERMISDDAYRQTWKKYGEVAASKNSMQFSFEKAWNIYREAGL